MITSIIRSHSVVARCEICELPAQCHALDLELGLAGGFVCSDCLSPLMVAERELMRTGFKRPTIKIPDRPS